MRQRHFNNVQKQEILFRYCPYCEAKYRGYNEQDNDRFVIRYSISSFSILLFFSCSYIIHWLCRRIQIFYQTNLLSFLEIHVCKMLWHVVINSQEVRNQEGENIDLKSKFLTIKWMNMECEILKLQEEEWVLRFQTSTFNTFVYWWDKKNDFDSWASLAKCISYFSQ